MAEDFWNQLFHAMVVSFSTAPGLKLKRPHGKVRDQRATLCDVTEGTDVSSRVTYDIHCRRHDCVFHSLPLQKRVEGPRKHGVIFWQWTFNRGLKPTVFRSRETF